MLNILFVGDVYGKTGRQILLQKIQELKVTENIQFVIANTENATNGKAISWAHYQHLEKNGVDCFTMGNHTFTHVDILEKINQMNKMIRPLNYLSGTPGCGSRIFEVQNLKIRIINLLGRHFMNVNVLNPFFELEKILNKEKVDINIVDFHAETTAEKIALGYAFDGQISALLGTHTHVQTNDARFLKKGTFFITDAGMTGPHHSIIGAKADGILKKETSSLPFRIRPAQDDGQFSGVILQIDEKQKKIVNFKIIYQIL